MSTLRVIENKISAAGKYLKILLRYKILSQAEIIKDVDKKGALERYLYLAVQSTIDLAEAAIAYKKFRKPSDMAEAFHILNEEGVITDELTEKMAGMVGFRNIITHDYGKINYDIVYNVLQNRLPDIEDFIKIISKKI